MSTPRETHKFDVSLHGVLHSVVRRRMLPERPALELLELGSGLVALEVGCGTGYFLLPMAVKVGYAIGVDVSEKMLRRCMERVRSARAANVGLVRCGESTIPLRSGSVQRVLIANALHEMHYPEKMLREVRRVLCQGGLVLVVEWKKRCLFGCLSGPPKAHRLSSAETEALLIGAGFSGVEQCSVPYRRHYVLRAVKG